ncbi:hypothetical protein GGR51DRAFT_510574 [Nemania sp. FL0031]|nr:hypothetical protein GGR51DRAFT_510574 [Nemania sp. FL0031]
MYSSKLILLAALAGTSLSQKSDSEFCASLFTSFASVMATDQPTTPAAILSFIASNTISSLPSATIQMEAQLDPADHQAQLCSLATALPSSLLPDLQTLASGLLSFGKAHSSDFIKYVTDCYPEDEVAATSSYFASVFAPTATGQGCDDISATPAPGGASNGTYPTAAPTATSAFNGTTTSMIPVAAAARPTGALLGAAAIGGLLGAAALL